jgi:hypothetical protein
VVDVLVNLLLSTVLAEKSTENSEANNPEVLGGHTGDGSTAALTLTRVTAETLGSESGASASARVDLSGLADDKTVLDELADVLARVSHGDLVNFIGVDPNTALTALEDVGRKALLKAKGNPTNENSNKSVPKKPPRKIHQSVKNAQLTQH